MRRPRAGRVHVPGNGARVVTAAIVCACILVAQSNRHAVGRAPSEQEIRALGVTVAPDGKGLPEGSGTVAEGRTLFAQKCAASATARAEGDVGPALTGGRGTLATAKPRKTVGGLALRDHATGTTSIAPCPSTSPAR